MMSFNKTLLEIFSPSFCKHFSIHNLSEETWKEADILQSLWKTTDMVASPPFPTPFLGPERGLWVSNIPGGRGPTLKPLPEKGCERHKQAEKGTWHFQQVLEGTAAGDCWAPMLLGSRLLSAAQNCCPPTTFSSKSAPRLQTARESTAKPLSQSQTLATEGKVLSQRDSD